MSVRSILALFLSRFSSDLAIDLGTATTCVYARGKGLVLNQPSIVAINRVSGRVEAVGSGAKDMLGCPPSDIIAIRPMRDGVIADFEVTEKMLAHFIKRAHGRTVWVRPRIVIGLLNESEEQLAAMPRPTPIEPERELVEVVIQMRVPDPTLMRTEQPPFEQRDHPVDARARILKDGAGGDRGLATTPRTLPPPGPQGPRLGASTAGALKAGGPAKACEVGGAGFLGIEPSLELGPTSEGNRPRPRTLYLGVCYRRDLRPSWTSRRYGMGSMATAC